MSVLRDMKLSLEMNLENVEQMEIRKSVYGLAFLHFVNVRFS